MPRSPRSSALALAALLLAAPAAARAGQPAGHGCSACASKAAEAAAAAPRTSAEAAVTLADVPLLDQDGREVRLAPDVVGGRIVVVDFIFTTCTTVCPILSSKLARLQERLGPRLAEEVRLVSISIDPARDTPARLKAFAARFGAGPGWTWLTGDPAGVEKALRGLGAYSARPADHAPLVLVGDGRTGRWERHNGYPDPAALEARVEALAAARRVATAVAP